MNKSIALFSSGALVGAVAAASLFYYSGSSIDKLRATTLTPSSPAMAQVQKELSTILAKLELISTGVDSLGYKTSSMTMSTPGKAPPEFIPESQAATTNPKTEPVYAAPAMQPSTAAMPVTPAEPTSAQIDQYNSIKYRLYEAANNPTAKLSDLIKMGEQLTPEQRQDLTNEVMAMVKRGELSEKQFLDSP